LEGENANAVTGALDALSFHFCYSVPPYWQVAQLQKFPTAFVDHSFPVETISEPVACLKSFLNKTKNPRLQTGEMFVHCSLEEHFIVVSCYNIVCVSPYLDLRQHRCQVIHGGLVDVLNGFRQILESVLIGTFEDLDDGPEATISKLDSITRGFEKFLPRLDGTKDYKCALPWDVPDDPGLGIVANSITISAATLRDLVFKPYLELILTGLECIERGKDVKLNVMLSGVLSECPYVTKFLNQKILNNSSEQAIQMLQVMDG
jgi:hypothetical protein